MKRIKSKGEGGRGKAEGQPGAKTFRSIPVFLFPPSAFPLPPSGYSLIETVVAMSLILVLMTVSGTLFTALSRSERNAQRAAAAQQNIARLDTLFRGDVHRAKSAAISQDDRQQPVLTLTLSSGGTVRYVTEAAKLERVVESDGGVHRDAFRIADATWRFEITGEKDQRVELMLERPADTVTQNNKAFVPIRNCRLMAALSLTRSTLPKPGATP